MLSLQSCHEPGERVEGVGVQDILTSAFYSGLEGGQKHLVKCCPKHPSKTPWWLWEDGIGCSVDHTDLSLNSVSWGMQSDKIKPDTMRHNSQLQRNSDNEFQHWRFRPCENQKHRDGGCGGQQSRTRKRDRWFRLIWKELGTANCWAPSALLKQRV